MPHPSVPDFGPLAVIYNDPKQGLSSTPSKLRAKALAQGYTYTLKQVTEFISEQQTHQRYFNRRRLKYFSIKEDADAPFERVQVDILDMQTQVPAKNAGARYLYLSIDCYSRYISVVPMKSKSTGDCVAALKATLAWIENLNGFAPQRLDSDNEPSFTSSAYRAELKENDVQPVFSQVGDHKSLAFVDGASRIVRLLIAKYLEQVGGVRWIDHIGDLIDNYNHTIQTALGCTPQQVVDDDIQIGTRLTARRQRQDLRASKQAWSKQAIVVGSRVRVLLPQSAFQKGTTAKFSQQLHTVTSIEGASFFYVDRDISMRYRKYELLLVTTDVGVPPPSARAVVGEDEEKSMDGYEQRLADAAERRRAARLAREGMAPHRYAGPGGPDNSLEARYAADVAALPHRRERRAANRN